MGSEQRANVMQPFRRDLIDWTDEPAAIPGAERAPSTAHRAHWPSAKGQPGKFIRSLTALDWLNFLLADVQGGLGPFLAIYLWSSVDGDATHVGVVMTIAGIATVAMRAPAGALVDWTVRKRALIVAAAGIVGAGAIVICLFPSFWPMAAAQTLIGACDAAFSPAITAISLGLVGGRAFTGRVGRNELFNHAATPLRRLRRAWRAI